MTDSAANADERKRQSAFKRGDVLIFVVFPIVLVLGFLLFRWWRKTSADPNLQLVAQVTDDISVELVAVASQNQANGGPKMWWKPNGLPASDEKEIASGITTGSRDPGFHFLYRYRDERPGKSLQVRGAAGSSGGFSSETRESGSRHIVIVAANAKPDLWNSIVIHRTVYDAHVMFESVSAQLDSITFPRIGEISKVRHK